MQGSGNLRRNENKHVPNMYRGDAVRMVEGDREKGEGKREGGIGGI